MQGNLIVQFFRLSLLFLLVVVFITILLLGRIQILPHIYLSLSLLFDIGRVLRVFRLRWQTRLNDHHCGALCFLYNLLFGLFDRLVVTLPIILLFIIVILFFFNNILLNQLQLIHLDQELSEALFVEAK